MYVFIGVCEIYPITNNKTHNSMREMKQNKQEEIRRFNSIKSNITKETWKN